MNAVKRDGKGIVQGQEEWPSKKGLLHTKAFREDSMAAG